MSKYQEPKNIKNITVIGGGIIGSSWAALFSAYGKNVKISEPCSNTRNTLLERIKKAQKSIKILNNVNLKNKGKIIICKSLNEAIHKTDFVQESAPDKSEIKKHIFEDLDLNLHRKELKDINGRYVTTTILHNDKEICIIEQKKIAK